MGDSVSPSWTAVEVNVWLQNRNLTEAQCKEFEALDGKDVLSLQREDFESVVGKLKATALYNQLHSDDGGRGAEMAANDSPAKRRRVHENRNGRGSGGGSRAGSGPSRAGSGRQDLHNRTDHATSIRPPPPMPSRQPLQRISKEERGRPGVPAFAGNRRPYDHLDLKTLPVVQHHELAEPLVAKSDTKRRGETGEDAATILPVPPRPLTTKDDFDDHDALDYAE